MATRDSSFEDNVRRRPPLPRKDSKQELQLQQTAGNAAVGRLLSQTPGDKVRSVVQSKGKEIDSTTSSFVKSAIGADVSGIRVHDGAEAEEAARSVEADMFASGSHLVAPKGLDVTTKEGAFKTLHEVHHIVNQQAKGPVDGKETEDGLKISDPSDRFEQDADRAAAEGVARHFGG